MSNEHHPVTFDVAVRPVLSKHGHTYFFSLHPEDMMHAVDIVAAMFPGLDVSAARTYAEAGDYECHDASSELRIIDTDVYTGSTGVLTASPQLQGTIKWPPLPPL